MPFQDGYLIEWDDNEGSYRVGSNPYAETPYDAFNRDPQNCPKKISPPRRYNDNIHGEHTVSVIGRFAFRNCGNADLTTSVFLPKEIKLIRFCGISGMYCVSSFVIEHGSALEVVEERGLADFGRYTHSYTTTLSLPPTLKLIQNDGIYRCDMFKAITFCGIIAMTNPSTVAELDTKPKIYVSSWYPGESFLGFNAITDSTKAFMWCSGIQYYYSLNRPQKEIILISFLINIIFF